MPKPISRITRSLTYKGLLSALPLLAILSILLNGCAVKQPVQQPRYPKKVPVGTSKPAKVVPPRYPAPRPPSPAPTEQTDQTEQVTKTPTIDYTPKMGPGGALYSSARDAFGQGNYQQAEMMLERALKIEPRNAHYWFTMAQIKYKQQQYSQTVHLCSKSKSLAGRNAQLLQLNDDLSAKAQQRLSSSN